MESGQTRTLNYKQYLRDEEGEERGEKPFSVIDGFYTQHGTGDLSRHFDGHVVLQFPKPVGLIRQFLQIAASDGEGGVVLDFFAGSGTTAEACMSLPAETRDAFSWMLIQLDEATPEGSIARKLGFETVADIAKERIRRAGRVCSAEAANADVGFRVLKIDSSNMADVFYTPAGVKQGDLLSAVESIKPGRDNPRDLLFQVLVDWGVDLTLPISKETVKGKTVFFVNDAPYDLIACFDKGVTEELVKELAKHEPMRVVFRDNGFASDAVKINVDQIFRQLSPSTDVKSI